MTAARLTIYFPTLPARVFLLPEGRETVVGRGSDCDLSLADDRVSRRHARFAHGPSGWTVTDLESKNGTLVDAVRIGTGAIGDGSWISFAGLLARFETSTGPLESIDQERSRRLSTASEVRRGFDPRLGLASLLKRVVGSILALSSAERGFLLLLRDDGGLEVAAEAGPGRDGSPSASFAGSRSAVHRALETGIAVVSADARLDAELRGRESVIAGDIRALVCVPVVAEDRAVGVMYADSRRPGAVFTELDVEILEALAAQAGLAIAVAGLDGELRGLTGRLSPESIDRLDRLNDTGGAGGPGGPGAPGGGGG